VFVLPFFFFIIFIFFSLAAALVRLFASVQVWVVWCCFGVLLDLFLAGLDL